MSDQPAPFPIDRKVWAPTITGPSVSVIATFGIVAFAKGRGVEIPDDVQIEITAVVGGVIGFITGWIVPMAKREIERHLSARSDANEIVAAAQADDKSNVDLSKVITDRIVIEAQLDTANPAVTMPKGETIKSLETKLAVEKRKPRERKEKV